MRDLVRERAEAGDVQTCVSICELLSCIPDAIAQLPDDPLSSAHDDTPPSSSSSSSSSSPGTTATLVDLISSPTQRHEWYWWYVELLHRLGLHEVATEIVARAEDERLRELTVKSTTFYVSCARCRKPMAAGRAATHCSNCRGLSSMCAVRGLFFPTSARPSFLPACFRLVPLFMVARSCETLQCPIVHVHPSRRPSGTLAGEGRSKVAWNPACISAH